MKRFTKLHILPLIVVAVCLPTYHVRAAVEDYVPRDALGVLKVTALERHYEQFVNSPLAAKLRDPEFVPELADKIEEAEAAIGEFERAHDVDVRNVLMDILGREWALAAFPDETGVLVVEAQDERALRRAVEEFERLQGLTGDLLDTAVTRYKGVQVHASEMKGGRTRYHAMSGRVLAVSEDRPAVERVIDTATGSLESIAGSRDFRQAMQLAARDALAVAYVEGAALEKLARQIRQKAQKPGDRMERLIQGRLAEALPLTRFLVVSILHEQDLTARLTVAYDGDRLPAGLAAVLPDEGMRLDVLELAPRDAAVAVARGLAPRGCWHALTQMLQEAAPPRADRAHEAMDGLVAMVGGVYSREDLLTQFSGQFALMLLPAETSETPPAAALVIGLRDTAHVPAAAESIVGALVTFARAEGKHEVTLEHTEHEGVRLTTVRRNAPGVWRKVAPTFGVVEGSLVVTTSQDAARHLIDTARGAARMRLRRTEGTTFGAAVVNAPAVLGMLDRYDRFLVRHTVEKEGKPEAQARRELTALRKLLSLLDRLEYAAAFAPGRTDHYLCVNFAHDAR